MTREEKQAFALSQYNAGDTVRAICASIGITTPTFYRWLRDNPDFEPRKPDSINKTLEPSQARSEAAKRVWIKRQGDNVKAIRDQVKRIKRVPLLDILNRFNLSLALDNQGHSICHKVSDKRLYITETEFKALQRDPITTIKQFAPRINATFGGNDDE